MGNSGHIIRELTDRHLQSIVSLKVQWKDPFQEGRQPIPYSASGSIIQASIDFIFILTCSHTFKPFTVGHDPDFDSVETINANTDLEVAVFDGHVDFGQAYCIDWSQDMCLVLVPFPLKSSYQPVRFIDDEDDMLGQSVYTRETKVYSIYCFPTSQKETQRLFGTTVKGKICGHNDIIGNDLDPVYRPDLRIFEFEMAGAAGCSGAPIFNKDFLFIGMWISRVADLKFALKLNQIQSKTMNEIVAKASASMSAKLAESTSLGADLSSMDMEIFDGVDLSSLETSDGIDLSSLEIFYGGDQL
ncbi:hypothetical protein ACQ4PT_056053 [Festuca glaucescens]